MSAGEMGSDADDTAAAHGVHIRPACPADFDQLVAVDARVFGDLAYPYFVIRQLFDAFPDCWLVAAHHVEVVGYTLAVPSADHECAWMFAVAVDAGHRGRGYGRLLTAAALDTLCELAVRTVQLAVEPANTVALDLYRSLGFVEVGQRRDHFGPGEDRLLMVCDLTRRRRGRGARTRRPHLRGQA